ncbi:MAG: gliding motility-associated C-terminal domain-containing protein [Bacteroidia bacterium]|nr:gliding motility-associated C-terminal domain-containing protein [Bacteroidia bacterium]
MKRLYTLIFTLLSLACYCQSALDCNGSIYRVIEKSADISTLQKLYIDSDEDNLQVEHLAIYRGHRLNAMCYRPEDNSLYGLRLASPYELFKIDEDLSLSKEKVLPLPESLNFVAGDIHPDGDHMIVLGYGIEEQSNLLAIIDLSDPNYHTEMIPLSINGTDEYVICADIAFHPTTGILYGFDRVSNKMMRVDIEDGHISLFSEQVYSEDIGVVPSIFFDHEGHLYGFSISDEDFGSNKLYEFDTETGVADYVSHVDDYGSQDGCSCPFKVQMQQSINNKNQYACTEAQFVIKLINRTPLIQTGLALVDTLPIGMTVKSVDYNPFVAISHLSSNYRTISFTDFDLPIGEDSIVYTVYIDENVQPGYYENQAWLTQENPDSRSNLVEPLPSDDPVTSIVGDRTGFLIEKIKNLDRMEDVILCQGDILQLNPNVIGSLGMEWSTGAVSEHIDIVNTGTYDVTITGNCGTGRIRYRVASAYVDVELGEDRIVDKDQKIELSPLIESSSDIRTVIWSELNTFKVMECYTCMETTARIPLDMGVQITVRNADGCIATDELYASVEDIKHYIPNAFSPNGDGHNDIFYLQSKKNYLFKNFSIYDRWGNRQFIQQEGSVNDESYGWNGAGNGKALNPGVYIWQATIVGLDDQERTISGDITLLR